MTLHAPAADRAVRRWAAMLLCSALALCVLCIAIATPAQAHVPYLTDAWGLNLSGQLGDGSEGGPEECSSLGELWPCSTTAVQIGGLSGATALAGGEEHSLAVLGASGSVMAWGANESEQLGDGYAPSQQAESDVPVAVCAQAEKKAPCAKTLTGAVAVAAGDWHSLALMGDTSIEAWGDDESGQLGTGFAGPAWNRKTPTRVKVNKENPLTGVTAIAAGEEHSLALLSSGAVVAFGSNEWGQIGNGSSASLSRLPSAVKGLSSGVLAIAAGEDHSLAVLSNHTVVAWGSNVSGQLGTGSMSGPEACVDGPCSRTPVPVQGLSKVTAIAAGGNHSLALLENGTVVAWGENEDGELGNGATTNSDVPVPVGNLSGVTAIAAGEAHSLALLGDGTVWAWGANGEGELGAGTASGPETCGPPGEEESCSRIPVVVGGLSALNVKAIAAGSWHSLALGPPNPAVTGVSPKEGPEVGGTLVTISGREFTEASAVKFGSANATAFKVESSTSITAISPQGSATVDVTVTTPEGTSRVSPADQFSYVQIGSVVKTAVHESEHGNSLNRPAQAASTYSFTAPASQAAKAAGTGGFAEASQPPTSHASRQLNRLLRRDRRRDQEMRGAVR